MIDAQNQPQAIYTKQGSSTPMPSALNPNTGSAASLPANQPKKKSNWKWIGIGLGLLSFLVIGGAIIFTTFFLEKEDSVAPTLPKAASDAIVCSLAFDVTEELTCNSICTQNSDCSAINPDYSCYPVTDTESRCRLTSNPENEQCLFEEELECDSSCTSNSECQDVNENYICYEVAEGDSRCRLDENPTNDECTVQETELECNSVCETNEECAEVDENYICSIDYGNRCRHADYRDQEDCEPDEPEPTPEPGCNDLCETSSDCANPDHICFETSSGDRCRLDEYPWSSKCIKPSDVVKDIYTPKDQVIVEEVVTTVEEQPELPEQLPETGITHVAEFAAGSAALVITALTLLLLL